MTDEKNYNYFETEKELVAQVNKIESNKDTYGEEVEVVARRAAPAESDGRGNGYAYEYKLSDGRVVSNDQAWELANAGKLKGVIGSHNHGRKYIKGVGDGKDNNNLGNLPSF